MLALAFTAVLAAILGFATHRASVCTVRAVAELLSSRRGFMLASIVKSILWASAVTIPFFLISMTMPPQAGAWQLSVAAVLGGFVFGVDAAWLARPTQSLPRIGVLIGWIAVVVLAAFALYEATRLWRTRPPDAGPRELVLARQYRLSTAALLIGVTAGAIYLIMGPYGYATTVQQGIEAALGRRVAPETARWVLLAAALFGMLVSTLQRKSFRLDWRPRPLWLMNFFGGGLMGLGVALAPGGNDSLVLYAIPTLSPHALPAYAALALGIAAGLLTIRRLLRIETRVECRNDLYSGVTRRVEKKPGA